MNFINNTKNEIIENALNGYANRMNNNFYLYQNNYVIGTYFNINDNLSSSSKSTGLIENFTGTSPLKYDKYINMPIAGISDIDVEIEPDDFGEEGSEISGEIFLFPNTIIPTPGDKFTLNHIPHLLFKVISSTTIKLDNGKNMWKLSYKLSKTDINKTNLDDLVVNVYHVLIENIGSDMKVAISDDTFKIVSILDDILSYIKNMYMANFYSKRVDTLILEYEHKFIYDPYLIEFIIRNDLLNDSNIKTIFYHHLETSLSFNSEFNNTIFSAILKNDISRFKTNNFNLSKISDEMSIFLTRNEDYFEVRKGDSSNFFFSKFSYFSTDIELEIKNINTKDPLIKIINSCINNRHISNNELIILENLEISNTKYYFYIIPLLIFSIDKYIKKLLSKSNK